jgi:hypothetical protein
MQKMDVRAAAARLRAEAEARPLTLPVRRRVDDRHRVVTPDGLTVWFTLQVSTHARIREAVFERAGATPTDKETAPWIRELFGDAEPQEAPGIPGSATRRFEFFERDASAAPSA